MDKALERITKLKEELEKLYIEKDNIEDKIDIKVGERGIFYRKNEKLASEVKDLDSEKSNIQYKLTNIKKWKTFTILKTTLIALYLVAGIILLNLKLGGSVLATAIFAAFAVPFAIFFFPPVNCSSTQEILSTR